MKAKPNAPYTIDGTPHKTSRDNRVKLASLDPEYSCRYNAIGRLMTKARAVAPPATYSDPTIAFKMPPSFPR